MRVPRERHALRRDRSLLRRRAQQAGAMRWRGIVLSSGHPELHPVLLRQDHQRVQEDLQVGRGLRRERQVRHGPGQVRGWYCELQGRLHRAQHQRNGDGLQAVQVRGGSVPRFLQHDAGLRIGISMFVRQMLPETRCRLRSGRCRRTAANFDRRAGHGLRMQNGRPPELSRRSIRRAVRLSGSPCPPQAPVTRL